MNIDTENTHSIEGLIQLGYCVNLLYRSNYLCTLTLYFGKDYDMEKSFSNKEGSISKSLKKCIQDAIDWVKVH